MNETIKIKNNICIYLDKKDNSKLLKHRELYIFKEVLENLGPDCNYLIGCTNAIMKNKGLWDQLKKKI